MRKPFLALTFVLCYILSYSQADKQTDKEAFKIVDAWLDAQKDFEKLPGITVALIDNQKLVWSAAYGYSNKEKSVMAQPSTIFSICSISKLFTSVAVMKLYDEGKIRLDDKVSDLLPAYKLKQKYPESGPVTIRSLLTHSSGLPRESDYPYWTAPDFKFPTKEQVDSKLKDQETLYPASTYFQYSNLGLTLLGEIVEQVSGMPYDEYVKKNILGPLGLSNTRTELPENLYGKELAIGYGAITREGGREKVNFFQANGIKPAAGYSSTVLDLGKFASWQFRLRDTTVSEILKPSTLKYMQQVQWMDPDWETTWGLGFSVYKGPDGTTWAGHGGSCPGYRSVLTLDLKNKKAYSVMINAGGTNPGKYVQGIYGIIKKLGSQKKKDSVSGKINYGDYEGYYSIQPWGSEVFVSTYGDKLVSISLPNDKPGDGLTFYKHIQGDTFQRIRDDGEPGEACVFERDKSGRVASFLSHSNYMYRINR